MFDGNLSMSELRNVTWDLEFFFTLSTTNTGSVSLTLILFKLPKVRQFLIWYQIDLVSGNNQVLNMFK